MKKTKLIKVTKNTYIPHAFGRFNLNAGDFVRIKVIKVKK